MAHSNSKNRKKPPVKKGEQPVKAKKPVVDVDPTLQAWERGDSIELAPDETEYTDEIDE